MSDDSFFLFIGSASTTESATSRLKTDGVRYKQKLLESAPENWRGIVDMLKDDDLSGVVASLNSEAYKRICKEEYAHVAPELLQALADTRHVVFIHQELLMDSSSPDEDDSNGDDNEDYAEIREHYRRTAPSDEVREQVGRKLKELEINILPYRTNAQLSVLAAEFMDYNERNLLFRVYVPAGRLYAEEADKLLELFRDWLTQTRNAGVRQDGYATAAGKVYEFYGDDNIPGGTLEQSIDEFANFLQACMENPGAAESTLLHSGVAPTRAPVLVQKYNREARRIQTDLRQQRELKVLLLKHSFETDVIGAAEDAESDQVKEVVQRYLEQLVPAGVGNALNSFLHVPSNSPTVENLTINVQPQTIHAFRSHVSRDINGTVNYGPQAQELLGLIEKMGGGAARELESAVLELEDPDARSEKKQVAAARLKKFLIDLGGQVTGTVTSVGLSALQKYLESKVGLS